MPTHGCATVWVIRADRGMPSCARLPAQPDQVADPDQPEFESRLPDLLGLVGEVDGLFRVLAPFRERAHGLIAQEA